MTHRFIIILIEVNPIIFKQKKKDLLFAHLEMFVVIDVQCVIEDYFSR